MTLTPAQIAELSEEELFALAFTPEEQEAQLLEDAQAGELDRIEQAKGSLSRLVEQTSVIKCEPWQLKLCDLLQKLPFQSGQRIAIKAPPQTGKTTTGAQRLPAFYWGHNPKARVRLLTYNETHSKDHGRVIQQVMKSDYYRSIFTDRSAWIPDEAPQQFWSTLARQALADGQPSFSALGLQSGVVGGGGELYIFDDPYSSRDDAFSDTTNEKMQNIWKENVLPRLSPYDNVLSLCHAWNERDFNQFLLEECGFTEIRIASICDSKNDFAGRPYIEKAATISYEEYRTLSKGEKIYLEQAALTPRQPLEHLLRLRDGYKDDNGNEVAGMGEAAFESLHQGNPKSRGGRSFQKEDFRHVPAYSREPDSLFISYWDLGGSDNSKRDRTTNWLLHKTPGNIFTFVEAEGFRLRMAERNDRISESERRHREKYEKEGMVLSFVEWQMGTAVEVTEEIVRRCAPFGMREDHVTKKLEERAQPLQVQMQNGNVRFLEGVVTREIEDEFLAAYGGKHDDYISAAAGAYNKAAELRML